MSAYVLGGDLGMLANPSNRSVTLSLAGIPQGALILAEVSTSAVNSTVSATNFTWVQLSPVSPGSGSGSSDSICFGRIATGTETSEIFTWAAGQAGGDVAYFTGAVYTDLSTIVVASAARQSTNQSLINFSAVTLTPPVDGCLVVSGGRKVRTNSTAGTFGAVSVGSFNELSFQPVGAISFAQACVWDYEIQTTATALGPAAQTWSVADGTAQNEQGWIIALQPAQTQPIAGTPSIGVAGSGNLNRVSGAAAIAAAGASQLSTQILAAGAPNIGTTVLSALTNWATVTLSGDLYTGPGGILDPNFWVDEQPSLGTMLYYDATNITIYANGEISSATNNCSAVVQWQDADGVWSIGVVVLTPQMVGYISVATAATAALTTAIQMATAAIVQVTAAGNLSSGINLAGNALAVAIAATSLTTGVQLTAGAAIGMSGSGALTGGQASLQGNAAVLAQALAQLQTKVQLAAQVLVNSTVAGALSAHVVLSGAAAILTQASTQLNTAILLSGSALASSTAAGSALLTTSFAGVANAVSAASAQLKTGLQLAGNALIQSAAGGDLSTGVTLAGGAEIDTVVGLNPPGLEVQFGKAVIELFSPTGLPVDLVTIIAGSSLIASIEYFNAKGDPFVPTAVSYSVQDVETGFQLVDPTSIGPQISNSVTITGAQNVMVNLSRGFEKHQILFTIIDGKGGINYAAEEFELVRRPGTLN